MSSNQSSISYSVDSFGPTIPKGFDFTLLFEDSLLSIVPSALLLLVLPLRILALRGKPRTVYRSLLYENKLLFLLVFACMQTTLLALFALNPKLRTKATVAAAVLNVIDSVGLCVLSNLEHLRSVRPSIVINVYLVLTLPFDVARSRSLWLDGATKSTAAVFSSTICIKVMVLITEAIEKRYILLDRYQNTSPEVTSGIYSRSFFWWLNTLMTTGFRRVLTNEDLYPIDHDMTSTVLSERGHRAWANSSKEKPRALLWATPRASWAAFAYCIFPRICLMGFRYSQPFLLSRTVNFANNRNEGDDIGWGLTTAFGLVFLGMAIAQGAYYHMVYRFVVTVRGTLVSLIFAKTMDLSIISLDESVAVTLMANDTEAICQAFKYLHELWAVPIELALALYLLYRQLGLAFLAPGAVAIISTAGIFILAKSMGNAQKVWIQGIQTRVDVTSSMISSMKSVKMLGFTSIISNIINNLRTHELELSNKFRTLLIGRVVLANSTRFISPLATFAVFVVVAKSTGQTLNTASAFSALSLISLLAEPMNMLGQAIPLLNAALACFTRIQNFLKSDARQDHRLPLIASTDSTNPLTQTGSRSSIELENLNPFTSTKEIDSIMLSAHNASFAWKTDAQPIVRDLTFELQRHKLCFLIGPVGSGKSTLLKGLLGETPSSQGFVYSKSMGIGFVDQTPWIQNGTIKENILGISSVEEEWYNQVVHVCGLEADIAILPKGHATPVGSAGISLSGGQKQRLALARAVYARKEFVMLDDVFSGLDAETEEHIFMNLLGTKGLLRKLGTTVLLATHAVHRLPYADYVISLSANGQIIQQGTFEELRNTPGYVQSLAAKVKSEESSEGKEKIASSPMKTTKQLPQDVEEIANETAELNRQTGDLSVYKHYFASIGIWPTLLYFGYNIIFGVSSKMTEFLLTYWTNAVKEHGNSVNGFYIGFYALLAGISLVVLVAGVWELAMILVPRSAKNLHAQLLNTVMNAPLSFFTKTDTGETTNRFSQDMTIIDTELPYSLHDLSFSIMAALMGATLMCLSAGYFATTVPPVILIVWVLQKYYLRTSRQMRLLDLEAKSPLYSHFIESLSGLVTIRAFGWGNNFQEKNITLLDNSQKPYYLLFCIQRWLGLILDLLVTLLAVILMILVVKLRTEISPGMVGLALLNVMSFNESLTEIIKTWTLLETSIGAISRLKTFSTLVVSENLPSENSPVPSNWPFQGSISFQNVSASYTTDDKLVIKNLSMEIQPGSKIGICGRSGSGKSSLITTLFRMLEITSDSQIIIDGIDITTIPRETLRSRLNAIPQEPFFIRGSIRLNADPYSLHTDTTIISALQSVHLWSLIQSKGGLDVPLDAEFFSHGQRQLFCLARAVLRRKAAGRDGGGKVVILDEATSSVDTESEKLMQEVIRREFEGCTILAVAHRLEGIVDFDKVALLGEGELREFESPGALLGRKSGFRELYES